MDDACDAASSEYGICTIGGGEGAGASDGSLGVDATALATGERKPSGDEWCPIGFDESVELDGDAEDEEDAVRPS